MRNSCESLQSVVSTLFNALRNERKDAFIVAPLLLVVGKKHPLSTNIDLLPETIFDFAKRSIKLRDESPQVNLIAPFKATIEDIENYCRKAKPCIDELLLEALLRSENEEFGADNKAPKRAFLHNYTDELIRDITLELCAQLKSISEDSTQALLSAIDKIPVDVLESFSDLILQLIHAYETNTIRESGMDYPAEITDFMLSTLEINDGYYRDGRSLLIPNMDNLSSSIFTHLTASDTYDSIAFSHDTTRHLLTRLRQAVYKPKWLDLQLANSYLPDGIEGFKEKPDHIIATPPFGMRIDRHSEKARTNDLVCEWVIETHEKLAIYGTAVIAIPSKFLWSRNSHSRLARHNLVESNVLDKVIQMPSGIFSTSQLSFSLLVLHKGRNHREGISFIDASEAFTQVDRRTRTFDASKVSLLGKGDSKTHLILTGKDLAKHEFDLTPSHYLTRQDDLPLEQGHTLVPLSKLLTITREQPTRNVTEGAVINFSNIAANNRLATIDLDDLDPVRSLPEQGRQYARLDRECILISPLIRGEAIHAAWFKPADTPTYIRPDVLILEFDSSKLIPEWLLLALRSERTSRQVVVMTIGSTIPRILTRDLLNLQLSVPSSIEQQRTIVEATKSAMLHAKAKELGLEEQIAKNEQRFWDDLSIKKHSMAPLIRNLQSGLKVLGKSFAKHGTLSPDTLVSRHTGNVSEYLSSLLQTAHSLAEHTEGLTERENLDLLTPLDLLPALNDWQSKQLTSPCSILLTDNAGAFSNDQAEPGGQMPLPQIAISRGNLFDLLDQILNNAVDHGFKNPAHEYILRINTRFDTEQALVHIEISNNGIPMPEGMDTRRYITRHEHAGPSGLTGIGGYRVAEIMSHVGGAVDLRNRPSEDFPVSVHLTFPTL